MSITDKQRELLTLLAGGAFAHTFSTPGREGMRGEWQAYLLKKGDHRTLDLRTINSLDKRGFIKFVGDGDYAITDEGKAALAAV